MTALQALHRAKREIAGHMIIYIMQMPGDGSYYLLDSWNVRENEKTAKFRVLRNARGGVVVRRLK